MKIRDLEFINEIDVRKLGYKYVDMTVEEYITEIEQQKENEQRINKPFLMKLYDLISEKFPELSSSMHNEETEIKDITYYELEKIPIDEIQYYVSSSEYTKNCGALRRKHIKNLGQLYLYNFPNRNRRKFEEVAQEWQSLLKEKNAIIISDWKNYHTTKIIPVEIDEKDGLIKILKKAIKEIASILSDRVHNSKYPKVLRFTSAPLETFSLELVASILHLFYRESKTINEIAQIKDREYEHIRNVHLKTITAIVTGDVICENLRLNENIVDWVRTVRKECLFHTEEELISIAGENDEEMFRLLGYDFVEVADVKFVIPKGTKGVYSLVGKSVISTLQNTVLPIDKDELFSKLEIEGDFNQEDFIKNILSCEKLIESKDEKILLRTEYLSSDLQKMARIMYEEGRKISSSEANEKFERLYGHPFKNWASLDKYGVICNQNKWFFSDKKLLSIQSFVNDYADEKEIFYYKDLISDMEAEGYIIPPEKSMRSYIVKVCQVDNNDGKHFCHKNCVDDYPEYSWRNQSSEGLSNWILNMAKDYLADKKKIEITELCDYIEKQAPGTGFENRIRERVRSVINTYSGDEKPFLIEENFLQKNSMVFDTIDFSILGLRGGKYPFFVQIRSIIMNELKKREDARILLTDAIELVNENINEPQNRNTIIRAISNKHLSSSKPINADIQNIDGRLYIVKVGDDIAPEPIYKIEHSVNVKETDVAHEVEYKETRPAISFRLSLNWFELENTLKRELSFYKNWMEYDHIDFEKAIEQFITFVKNSTNGNLNKKLPQNLYEYWFASTDSFDRDMYVSNLAIFFEGLLAEIKYQKDGVILKKKGLGDWALEYPSMARTLGRPSKLLKGFDRIFSDLYFKRNKFAHGEQVEMNSADTARTISDYTALYIFTVAKYS